MDHVIAARAQMGTSLAFHIVFAALGVGLPLLVVIAEGLWLRPGAGRTTTSRARGRRAWRSCSLSARCRERSSRSSWGCCGRSS